MQHSQKLARCAAALALVQLACAGDKLPELNRNIGDQIAAAYAGSNGLGAGGSMQSADAPGQGGSGGAGPKTNGGDSDSDDEPSTPAPSGGAGGGDATSSGGAGGSAGAPPSSSGGGTSSPPATPACDGFAILEANCGTSGCHGAGSNLGTFASSEAVARSYIGKSGAVTCSGAGPILNPDDPPASILIQKLSDSPPCGNYMPLNGMLLSDSDVDCLEDWIGSLK
jgi:hypothetical protein